MADGNHAIPRPEVRARDVRLDLSADTVRRHWFGGDPWTTHSINALFMVVPDGERWVMNSARERLPHVTDPALAQAAREFIRQEAMHGREHERMNRVMPGYGLPAKEVEALFGKLRRLLQDNAGPELNASIGAAFEHLTATLSELFMNEPEMLLRLDPEVRALVAWHLVEETEHKAVSFDLFAHTVGDDTRAYALRAAGMLLTLGVLVPNYFVCVGWLLLRDGELFNGRSMRKALREMFWRPGLVGRSITSALPYLKRGFHPWQEDNRYRIQPWREEYALSGDALRATEVFIERLQQNKAATSRGGPAKPAIA